MKIAVVHGYFLSDSGSGIYVRELCRQFVRDGHEVTLICQETRPEDYDFIDSFFTLKPGNRMMTESFTRERLYDGSCRMARPDIRNNLLTYVSSPETRFNNTTFQEAAGGVIEDYLEDNIAALKLIFKKWPSEIVQANHAIMQPYEVKQALEGKAPYAMTIHGSALNFSVKTDDRLVPYFLEGAEGASGIIALSEASGRDVVAYTRDKGLDVSGKTAIIQPGVDTDLFKPDEEYTAERDGSQKVAIIACRLLWTKGTHYAVAAVPLLCQAGIDIKLVLAGDGPMEAPLKELIDMLDAGRIREARQFIEISPELNESNDYGPVIPRFGWEEEELYAKAARGNLKGRIEFTGHLKHEILAPLLGSADVSLMPSIFSEAYGLSAVEGLSCGAMPIATYHSGLMTPLDIISDALKDPVLKSIRPGTGLTRAIADNVIHVLDRYPTSDISFRNKLHALAKKRFSWARTAEMYIMLFKG